MFLWGMGITRWILLSEYEYGRDAVYAGKENVVNYWKVQIEPPLYLPISCIDKHSTTDIHRRTSPLLHHRRHDQNILPLPLLPHFWRRRPLPLCPLGRWLLGWRLLHRDRHSRIRGLSALRKELGEGSAWPLRQPSDVFPSQRHLQSTDRLPHPLPSSANGMAIEGADTTTDHADGDIHTGTLVSNLSLHPFSTLSTLNRNGGVEPC